MNLENFKMIIDNHKVSRKNLDSIGLQLEEMEKNLEQATNDFETWVDFFLKTNYNEEQISQIYYFIYDCDYGRTNPNLRGFIYFKNIEELFEYLKNNKND
jgi:hypothetical protein